MKKLNKRILILLLLSVGFNLQTFAQREDGVRMRFNGFGDITAGTTLGTPLDKTADSLFKQFGEDPYPKGTNKGIGVQGLDLVNTVFINDNLTVQSEVNLQVPRGGTTGPSLDVERLYMDYKVSDKLGFQAGLMFTPIGFINRNLYSRAWLMNSVHMFRLVEEESGMVPNHFVGANTYGTFQLSEALSMKYIVGLGNARGKTPDASIYARNEDGYQATGLLEFIIQGPKDLRVGLSGYSNKIPTYRGLSNYGNTIQMDDSMAVNIQETGFNPYVHYYGRRFEFTGEYHSIYYAGAKDIGQPSSTFFQGAIVELAYNGKFKEKRLAPYVRYDMIINAKNSGIYHGTRSAGNNTLVKKYESDLSSVMVGLCYDLFAFNRIKIEYAYYLNGPFQPHAIVFQTAFGF